MRLSKSDGLLYIYNTLIACGVVDKNTIASKFEVSPKTISRYINDINSFFVNQNTQEYIQYSRKKGGYVLETREEVFLNKKDILAISKILLESRGFVKEELTGLIEKLTVGCQYEDKTYIRKFLADELVGYVEPKHGEKLTDKIWDISTAIRKQQLIAITYTKVGEVGKVDKLVNRTLLPQGILFSEYYFYLLAYIKGSSGDYPVIYRLDRIKGYKVLEEGFRVEYKNRFKEGEFRQHIQFMQSGKLQTIKFKFKGESIEALLDRLPTAEILSENDGQYTIKAKVFGRGIKMWLLSQGPAIEVLAPPDFREEMKECIKQMRDNYITREVKN